MKLTKYRIGLLTDNKKTVVALLSVKRNTWALRDYFELPSGVAQNIRWPRRYQVIAGLSDERVIMKTFSLDKHCTPAEIYQYILHHGEKLFHLPTEQLHFDFLILGQQDEKTRNIIACACRKNMSATLVQQCQQLGLRLHAVDYQPFAWLRALQLCQLNLQQKYALVCKLATHYLCVAKTSNQLWVQKEDLNHYTRIQDALSELGIEQRWNLDKEFLHSRVQLNIENLSAYKFSKLTLEQFTCIGLAAWSKHTWP